MNDLRRWLARFSKEESGQGFVEYGLIIMLVGVASVSALVFTNDALKATFTEVVGNGEFAPPELGPIGGAFTPLPPTATPVPQINSFTTSPGSPIPLNGAPSTVVTFEVQTQGSFTLYEVDSDGDGSYDLSWGAGTTDPALRQAALSQGSYVAGLRATAASGQTYEASLNLVVYETTDQIPDQAPQVSISADVVAGSAPLTVNFNSVVSFDHDSTSATAEYIWVYDELGGGGNQRFNGPAGETYSYTYSAPGTYQVYLQVQDSENGPGLQVGNSDRITIQVNPSTPTPTATATFTPTPCPYGAVSVPGTLNFENYNCDGYSDSTPANIGNNSYRTGDAVDLSNGGSGIYVSNTVPGEWLEYQVTTPTTGFYRFTLRYASGYSPSGESADQTLQIFSNSNDVTNGGVSIPSTGGYATFGDHQFDLALAGGEQTLRFQINGDYNLDYVSISTAPVPTPTVVPAGCTGLAYQAEQGSLFGNFEIGTDGSTQYVHVPNGTGNQWSINGNHRVEYCMVVSTPGTYRIRANVYSPNGNDDSFHVAIDGNQFLWDVSRSSSYGSDYVSHRGGADPVEVSLSAGNTTLAIYQREDGTRLDYIELELVSAWTPTPTPVPPTPTPTITPTPTQSYSVVFQDDFNRSNSNSLGNSWTEKRQNNKAEAEIVNNRLCFTDTSEQKNRPLVRRKFSAQNSGQVRASFAFDWARTGADSDYELFMTLGRNLPTGKNASQNTRATVMLVWSNVNGHQTLNYRIDGNDYALTTLSGSHSISIHADLDVDTFDLYVDGNLIGSGLQFENSEQIDSIRFTANGIEDQDFTGMCFDDVLIEHSPN